MYKCRRGSRGSQMLIKEIAGALRVSPKFNLFCAVWLYVITMSLWIPGGTLDFIKFLQAYCMWLPLRAIIVISRNRKVAS